MCIYVYMYTTDIASNGFISALGSCVSYQLCANGAQHEIYAPHHRLQYYDIKLIELNQLYVF